MPNKNELIEKIDKKNQLIIQSLVERYNTLIDLINNKKISQLTNNELAIEWQKRDEKYLLGKSIVKLEYMSEEDANKFGSSKRPIQILLSNGVWLTITQYDEGNNGGAIHTNIKKLEIIPVIY